MRKITALFILFAFIINSVLPSSVMAQVLVLPQPGTMVNLSPGYTPANLRGMVIDPNDPFKFDFIIYRGDEPLAADQKQPEYTKLIKYFLAALAVPDTDQWVNLSPYETARIIPDNFGLTEMGRDLLSQDYLLKQITSSLTNPESELGKQFWDTVYEKAWQKFGTTDIPTDVFNKVWIVPDTAQVYEKGSSVYVVSSHLKVLMEKDYLSTMKNKPVAEAEENAATEITYNVMKEVILPAIEKEVNEGKNFAPLRQVVSGMLLATWYKKALKESILGKIYADQGKVKGVDQDPKNNDQIYEQYVAAFKKGVFSMIKEDVDRYTQELIPRKYFSGGFERPDPAQAFVAARPDTAQQVFNQEALDLDQVKTVVKPFSDAAQDNRPVNRPTAISPERLATVGRVFDSSLSGITGSFAGLPQASQAIIIGNRSDPDVAVIVEGLKKMAADIGDSSTEEFITSGLPALSGVLTAESTPEVWNDILGRMPIVNESKRPLELIGEGLPAVGHIITRETFGDVVRVLVKMSNTTERIGVSGIFGALNATNHFIRPENLAETADLLAGLAETNGSAKAYLLYNRIIPKMASRMGSVEDLRGSVNKLNTIASFMDLDQLKSFADILNKNDAVAPGIMALPADQISNRYQFALSLDKLSGGNDSSNIVAKILVPYAFSHPEDLTEPMLDALDTQFSELSGIAFFHQYVSQNIQATSDVREKARTLFRQEGRFPRHAVINENLKPKLGVSAGEFSSVGDQQGLVDAMVKDGFVPSGETAIDQINTFLKNADPKEFLPRIMANHPDLTVPVKTVERIKSAPDLSDVEKRQIVNRLYLQLAYPTLCPPSHRALFVHNNNDGLGDELIQVNYLAQALLDLNPLTEVTIVTRKPFLYNFPGVKVLTPEEALKQGAISGRYDVVMDMYNPLKSYNKDLEDQLRNNRIPEKAFLYIDFNKDAYKLDSYSPQEVRVAGSKWDMGLKMNADNVYTTIYRMLAVFGLPMRIGNEENPESIITGVAGNQKDEQVWKSVRTVLERAPGDAWDNKWIEAEGRYEYPVAVLHPFGFEQQIKAGPFQNEETVINAIKILLEQGRRVVLMPNGRDWGTTAIAEGYRAKLPEDLRNKVTVAPEPGRTESDNRNWIVTIKKLGPTAEVYGTTGGIEHLIVAMRTAKNGYHRTPTTPIMADELGPGKNNPDWKHPSLSIPVSVRLTTDLAMSDDAAMTQAPQPVIETELAPEEQLLLKAFTAASFSAPVNIAAISEGTPERSPERLFSRVNVSFMPHLKITSSQNLPGWGTFTGFPSPTPTGVVVLNEAAVAKLAGSGYAEQLWKWFTGQYGERLQYVHKPSDLERLLWYQTRDKISYVGYQVLAELARQHGLFNEPAKAASNDVLSMSALLQRSFPVRNQWSALPGMITVTGAGWSRKEGTANWVPYSFSGPLPVTQAYVSPDSKHLVVRDGKGNEFDVTEYTFKSFSDTVKDRAQNIPGIADRNGGIDLNSAGLDMQIKRDGNGVPLPISQQNLDNIKINGLVPVILDILPAAGLPLFSEVATPSGKESV